MEEEVGFEPTVRYKRTTVFKTAPINRSGTPPFEFFQISLEYDYINKKKMNCKVQFFIA